MHTSNPSIFLLGYIVQCFLSTMARRYTDMFLRCGAKSNQNWIFINNIKLLENGAKDPIL